MASIVANNQERGAFFEGTTVVNPAEKLRKEREQFLEAAQVGLPPDWLTTGAAGAGFGWLFGLPGALVGAGITAILSKRRRQGVLAQAAQEADTGVNMLESVQKQLGIAERVAKDDDQALAEIALRREQLNGIAPLMSHPDPNVRVQAMSALLQMSPDLAGELDEIEAAQLDRERVAREQAQQIFANFQTIKDDFRTDTKSFVAERDAYKKLQSSFEAATPAGDIAGIFAFMKQLDPISTVRESEFATVQNAGGVDETTRALYNSMLTGEKLTATQRADFMNRSLGLYKVSLERYLDQESRFITEARAGKATDELIDTALIPYVIPREEVPTQLETPEQAVTPTTGPGERRVIEPSLFARGLQQFGTEAVELIEEIGRLGRGEVVVEEGGRYFVEDADGNKLKEIQAPNELIPDLPEPPKPVNRGLPGPIHPIRRTRRPTN